MTNHLVPLDGRRKNAAGAPAVQPWGRRIRQLCPQAAVDGSQPVALACSVGVRDGDVRFNLCFLLLLGGKGTATRLWTCEEVSSSIDIRRRACLRCFVASMRQLAGRTLDTRRCLAAEGRRLEVETPGPIYPEDGCMSLFLSGSMADRAENEPPEERRPLSGHWTSWNLEWTSEKHAWCIKTSKMSDGGASKLAQSILCRLHIGHDRCLASRKAFSSCNALFGMDGDKAK